MSEITTSGHSILVDPESGELRKPKGQPGAQLVSWLVGRVQPWRDHRNRNYLSKWTEYWRLWRGQWDPADKNRLSERSRLIAPALMQAIEMSVAEVEEAVLGKESWFDIADDIRDQEKLDATLMRDQLREDMDEVEVRDVISEATLVAAIFGEGTVKVNTEIHGIEGLKRNSAGELVTIDGERVVVSYDSYRPDQVIPDPSGRTVKEMQGIALEHRVPTHAVYEKIEAGIYRKDAASMLGGAHLPRENENSLSLEERLTPVDSDATNIIEYHGKVPAKFLLQLEGASDPLDELILMEAERASDEVMVEAIVTYANDNVLLRAIANPFVLKDRTVICFPWEAVPGRFWGRGVAEKGYNPQKALDAELRARSDSLGFVSAPMLGLDAGRIPRGFKPEVKPGKVWLTNGPPDDILRPVQIGALEPNTFNQTQELTQMVQMGTGAFDTATSLRGTTSSGGNAANSGSMLMGAFVKRSKRAIQNVSRKLLEPLIRKTALRYLQFDPVRYPFDDFTFHVKATLGVIAREMEQVNLTQLIGMLPEEGFNTKLEAAKGFIELSSVLNKADIIAAIATDKEQAQERSQQEQQQQQAAAAQEQELGEIAKEGETLKNQKIIAEIRKMLAEAESTERGIDIKEVMAILEGQRIGLQESELEQFDRQNDLQVRRLDLQEFQLNLKAREIAQRGSQGS